MMQKHKKFIVGHFKRFTKAQYAWSQIMHKEFDKLKGAVEKSGINVSGINFPKPPKIPSQLRKTLQEAKYEEAKKEQAEAENEEKNSDD